MSQEHNAPLRSATGDDYSSGGYVKRGGAFLVAMVQETIIVVAIMRFLVLSVAEVVILIGLATVTVLAW